MKRAAVLLFFIGLSLGLAAAAEEKSVVVAAGQVRHGDINTFGGRVTIAGELRGSVFMIGGRLAVSGAVSDDVICLGTEVEIAATARIGNDLWIVGSRLNRSAEARVGGRFVQVRSLEDMRRTAASVLPFLPESGDRSIFKVVKITFWFILALIVFAVFPERVSRSAGDPGRWPGLGVSGFGLYLLFIVLFVVFAALSLLLIGIPLLLVLFVAYFVALAFGRTVLFYFLGSRISAAAGGKRLNPTYYILIGLLPYAACKFIPFAGPILVLAMDFFVLGISARAFRRRRATTPAS